MKRKQKKYLYEVIYASFLLLWAIAFVLMPFGNKLKESSFILLYVSGGCFWLGLIGTIVAGVLLNIRGNRKFSFVRFFKNKFALATDIAVVVAVVGFIVSNELIDNLILSFVFLGLVICSLGLHFLFNSEEKEKKRKERKR